MEERIWHMAYDEGVPASIDYEPIPLSGLLERSARNHGERSALAFLNYSATYAALHDEVRRLATALARLGVEPGTRVGIQMPNLPQTVIGFLGTLRAGTMLTNGLAEVWIGARIPLFVVSANPVTELV